MKKTLNVTDLSSYLYCPRKFFFERVKGIKPEPSKELIEGRIRHEIAEEFSKKEEFIVSSFNEMPTDEIKEKYWRFLKAIIENNFEKNSQLISSFMIHKSELQEKILNSMKNEIDLRAEAVYETLKKGFVKEDLWENLEPKYLSEYYTSSEKLGLKGKVDRIMLGKEIVPFELKTRAIQKTYPSDEIQLAAYAMLLEDEFKEPVKKGILEAGNEKYELEITEQLKNKVLSLIEEINNLIENPPYPSNFVKCQKCSFKDECDL